MSSTTSNGSAATPAALATTPDYGRMGHITRSTARLSSMGMIPSSTVAYPISPVDGLERVSSASTNSAGFWTGAFSGQSLTGPTKSDHPALPLGSNFGFPPRQEMAPPPLPTGDGFRQGPPVYGRPALSPYATAYVDHSSNTRGRRSLPIISSNQFSWPVHAPLIEQSGKKRHTSLPPSRAGSVGPDDILAPDEIINPLGAMSNMAGLVEAAVERAREEQAGRSPSASNAHGKRTAEDLFVTGLDTDSPRTVKRARFSPETPTGPAIVESQNLPPASALAKGKPKIKRTHIHAYPDAVAEGYITEDEGRELMQM